MHVGYKVNIEGREVYFPHRVALLGQSIDAILGEVVTSDRMLNRSGPYLSDGREVSLINGRMTYRYAPNLSADAREAIGVNERGEAFFGDPHWSLEVVVRDDGSRLLVAQANRIIASRWLAYEPA